MLEIKTQIMFLGARPSRFQVKHLANVWSFKYLLWLKAFFLGGALKLEKSLLRKYTQVHSVSK